MNLLEAVIGQLSSLEREVVVALSGGADSAVLAHCAVEAGLSPEFLFVHHGLQGSDLMQVAAERVGHHLESSVRVVRVEMNGGSEAEARAVRYEVFEQIEGPVVLLGHTQSDQAETVMMHLLRGSGPVGISGIPHARGKFLRPLMSLTREQVREAARALGLPFADDPENDSPIHLRNWVRSSVIPLLRERSPDVERLLARTASLTHRAEPYVAEVGEAARLPLAVLRTLGSPERSESLREAVRRVRPPYPAAFAEVARMEQVVFGRTPRVELEGGLVAIRDRSRLFIGRVPKPPEPASIADGTRWSRWVFKEGIEKPQSSLWSRVPSGSQVRGAEPGDTISMGQGSKDVFAALTEAGVPRELRLSWPVVVAGSEIVWVPGVRRPPRAEESDGGYLGLDATEEIC